MATGRMIRRDICESDSFSELNSSDAQLLLCLLTPWWTDHGKMIGDPVWIKGNIVRKLKQFTEKRIIWCLERINLCTDVHFWTDENGNRWLYWPKFDTHQTISQAKKPKDLYPSPKIPKNPQKNPVIREDKIREVEDKIKGPLAPSPIKVFFDYFLLKTKKQYKLTEDRKDIISKRLTEGYTLDQLKKAVDNFLQDDWSERKSYIDIIYCIGKQKGKPDNLEKWLNVEPKKPKSELSKYEVRK